MDTIDAGYFAASLRGDALPSIDLHHTSSLGAADTLLEQALFAFASQRESVCRVVHGIGNGTMKDVVHDIVEKNPLVEDFQLSSDGGSTIVLLSSIR
ncbi:MAG: hypothetical protein COU34_05420 [Candidatus Magasanikbacteria bacterium CG10_big_fil_rev_8_21_14_0_10_43_9]|nr:MAG: hypothetical protein COU34_05420 [Candidatus Magasanikbacteria bacterium CG10_big_fil_rev_8_21_14_0_10_43_9]